MVDNFYVSNQEVDNIHWWLPSEILRDMGIVKNHAAEGHSLAIVEDLATRLTSVLVGSTMERAQHYPFPLHPPARSANSYGQRFHAPPPMEVWLFMRNGGKMVDMAPITPPMFAPVMWPPQLVLAAGTLPPSPAKWSGAKGMRAFLLQAKAYNNCTSMEAMGMTRLASVNLPHHVKHQQYWSRH
ncbi:hypothetical protein E2562_004072 [Oryza meyeriana var. granulata]|uniref:Uncharacterized protein n=1 Tax=Oryza meyeriana var. granulata TaxID=110450 RepID=A0A6G1BII3_9ORYZ|nr:hypothetical protein E2562_004072 [Oryza meyeriana var. granulata]